MDIPLVTSGCTVPLDKFWASLMIYHNRPHLVNKKLAGIVPAYFYEVQSSLNNLPQYFMHSAIAYEVRRLPKLTKESLKNFINDILKPYDRELLLKEVDNKNFLLHNSGIFISLRILIPKQISCGKCVEIVILNKYKNIATFIASIQQDLVGIAPRFPYNLELTSSNLVRCTINNFDDANTNSAEWLVDKLFTKILKWTEEDLGLKTPQEALQLITIDRYVDLYQNMKQKYGKQMIEIWPENTDPLKFVYEDIAIAAYLICLWESIDHFHKPSFVDLGCGNGLLVFILSQEGYPGYGIDVRKRRIWDLYPPNVNLKEKTIVPSSSSVFPQIDWIIGNHSDELTPWIPVIASRSSYKTNFFLLPCCSYDFSGRKYSRINTSKSVYNEYIEYLQSICQISGFITKIDKLKIPSTKRICLVSYGRSYEEHEFTAVDEKLSNFIQNRSRATTEQEISWVADFKPRPVEERVRNCTKLDRDLINRVILQVVTKLLETKTILVGHQGKWNSGGILTIKDLTNAVVKEDLKQLKNNCGGLQTLMRNHRYIFDVEKGHVKLRVPPTYEKVTKYKEKFCWFFNNHPDGCLHSSDDCAYKHVLIKD